MDYNIYMRIRIFKLFTVILLLFGSVSCKKTEQETVEPEVIEEVIESVPEPSGLKIDINVLDEGEIINYGENDYYRYGPSIMKYEDGSIDAWFARPGNSGSQWDWISYRHSDDGINWSDETVVLYPTPGGKDQCSVCDPGVIYFNGYYYLAYTGTDYYEGQGSYNMAFVARSQYPDGPFEKWDGSGWSQNPEPIIFYDGGKDNWGIGEVSFVIYDDDLYIYYTYIDIRDAYIGLCKADLVDNWPATIRSKGPVLYRLEHDSVEFVYDDNLDCFFAFSISGRLMEGSLLDVYSSINGKDFRQITTVKDNIKDYAHNLGVSKDEQGHIDSDEPLLLGYAYGKTWGKWNTLFQWFKIESEE